MKRACRLYSPLVEARSYRLINASGVYSAILRNHRPEAIIFNKSATSEVLRTIRKILFANGKLMEKVTKEINVSVAVFWARC